MYQVKTVLLTTIGLFFIACGGENSDKVNAKNLEEKPTVVEQDNTEVDAPQLLELIASDQAFYGISVQQPLNNYSGKLSKTTTKNGEGTFEVYEIKDTNGKVLGQVYPDPIDESLVGDIVILSPDVTTDKDVKIGTTFEELKAKFDIYEVHGSEIEAHVYFYQSNHAYRLDYMNNQYDLEESKIPANSKVINMKIMRASNI